MSPAALSADGSWRDEARLARILTWIATTIALIVSLAGPGGYFWLSYEAALTESAAAARLHAAFVTQAITSAPADWRARLAELIGTELLPSALPEVRLIHDSAGTILAQSGEAIAGPLLARAAPLLGPGGLVGEVVVTRSMTPILGRTAVVAGIALALGLAIYASLRLLPLRALRRSLKALKQEEVRAREEAEENLRIVFEHAIEGIVAFTPEGTLLSSNPAAQQMFGHTAAAMVGIPMTDVLQPPKGATLDDPFPVRKWESRAWRREGTAFTEFPVEVTINETRFGARHQRIGIIRDITERKETEERLSFLANYDSLTGLPNRSLFRDRLERAIARAQRNGLQLAVMFLDLDRFKTINDSLGHDVGDLLLQQVAAALSNCLRKTDTVTRNLREDPEMTVSRLGGDEFTILVEGLANTEAATIVAQRILDAVAQPFQVNKNELFISTSIGITLYPRDGTDLDGLIKQADMAMYRAKERGRNTYYFYCDELNAAAAERHALEASLRHALAGDEFVLHYQPKADLATGKVTGVEALLRWQPAGRKPVGPDKFIPILEDTGLIVPVGTWVLRQACAQMMSWRRAGLPSLNLAVNLSARQFRQQDLASQVAAVLAETGFDAHRLELELTESMLMDDMEGGVRILAGLAAMGIRVAIDDFGTGHSSLAYLKRFSVHTLKIDRSFVRDTPDDPEDSAIAIAVIALANSLKLRVVAEGVETPAQKDFLREQGCDEMQGYLLSRPLDPRAFTDWWLATQPAATSPSTA